MQHIWLQSSIFSMVVSLFHGSTWSNPFVKDTVFISQHFLESSIITSDLWLIWGNLKGIFIWVKPLQPCCFKGVYLFHRTSCSNLCLKSIVLNARKHFQLSHLNMTISWQLFTKFSKFFIRATVHVCICKDEFRSSYFFQKAALSEYL